MPTIIDSLENQLYFARVNVIKLLMGKEQPTKVKSETPVDQFGRYTMEDIVRLWRRRSFESNGRRIEFYGVAHVIETFERFKEDFEKGIDSASLVILEAAPEALRYQSDENIHIIQEYQRGQGKNVTKEEIRARMDSDRGQQFFRKLEQMAAAKGKPIMTIDPSTKELLSTRKLMERGTRIETLKFLSILAVFAPGALMEMRAGLQKRRQPVESEKKTKSYEPAKETSGMTRRDFLALLGGSLALLNYGSLLANLSNSGGREENPLALLLYNAFDYRDVAVAKGIDLVTKEKMVADEGPIMLVYGAGHNGIQHYMGSPHEREIRYRAYLPFRNIASPYLRLFIFKEGWKLEKEISF